MKWRLPSLPEKPRNFVFLKKTFFRTLYSNIVFHFVYFYFSIVNTRCVKINDDGLQTNLPQKQKNKCNALRLYPGKSLSPCFSLYLKRLPWHRGSFFRENLISLLRSYKYLSAFGFVLSLQANFSNPLLTWKSCTFDQQDVGQDPRPLFSETVLNDVYVYIWELIRGIYNLILDPGVEELEQEWQTEMPCKWGTWDYFELAVAKAVWAIVESTVKIVSLVLYFLFPLPAKEHWTFNTN